MAKKNGNGNGRNGFWSLLPEWVRLLITVGATAAAMWGFAIARGREEGRQEMTMKVVLDRLDSLARDMVPIGELARQTQATNNEQDWRLKEHDKRLEKLEGRP